MSRGATVAVLAAACLALTGCGSDPSTAPATSVPTTFSDSPITTSTAAPGTFDRLDADAAATLADTFVRLYGKFTPAAPNPGRTWLSSWSSLADKTVADRATSNFDAIWGWTWDQQVQAQDVQPTAPPSVTDTGFGTLTVQIPAKRYVIGLLAHRMTDGQWQNIDFDVVVGPKVPGNTASGLTVYKVDYRIGGA